MSLQLGQDILRRRYALLHYIIYVKYAVSNVVASLHNPRKRMTLSFQETCLMSHPLYDLPLAFKVSNFFPRWIIFIAIFRTYRIFYHCRKSRSAKIESQAIRVSLELSD